MALAPEECSSAKGKQGDVASCGESSEISDLEQILDQSCRAVAWQSQCYSWAGGYF